MYVGAPRASDVVYEWDETLLLVDSRVLIANKRMFGHDTERPKAVRRLLHEEMLCTD